MDRIELELYLNNVLETARFKDYCPNGLQVEGRRRVKKLATGVTASLAFLEAALEWGADAVLVHHGYFWRNEAAPITGRKYRRLKLLLANDLNLFAYHLPLDDHREYGNNAQLGARLGLIADDIRFGDNQLGWLSTLPMPLSLAHFTAEVEQTLGRTPLVFGDPDRELRRIGWCTGAAQGYFDAAIDAGADVYLTGEVSEPVAHTAAESGVAFIAAGHHATERYGVQSLGTHISETFDVEHLFIDIDNPV
ncbi:MULTISPECIES: Nif3-like dinuclear metal center hexameric protein [Paraburkholderia]|uniref:Dinuclear metal center protein, YbgI/SA1388 family n=1 Tax=Paraburkholderia megapolitana TaxID=420953 RepID=A0A1I3VE63_9BURK|nr:MULTISPECIES: Nif3-like dinuclear metal center hexameric protein [Paraburkholderia]MCX4165807.1 Nif3-like dinuclear metal center hexameric protein [Paraburkholderia megapolitana]MDN7161298.1 Nif3-like dinuclear metal center hexameric protein [Paraburkholderia sp. CHISQ3]MDQ6498345.1 Nif3-like dinuclear metal center hexameric protein [Paraburkholderia megapolitana]QDQ85498.1 Nif3-like dinuclear metal center hexameric protein [Paraburkholderia megapolitana]SFJ92696.1 dinuclear metal center pr